MSENYFILKQIKEKLSDTPIWWHDIYINVPLLLKPCQPSLFFILDGVNNVTVDDDKYLGHIGNQSVNCNCITVGMKQVITFSNFFNLLNVLIKLISETKVPNQPIKFVV